MKIAFNPSTVAALTTPPNNKDITFDLRGRNIFARGVKFCGTDTNTWRDIKINNVSIGSNILDLRNGSNTTLTNTNGVVTINSTWRPVVDNLTSDSTTSSLSANQGRVLAGLINTLSTNISNLYALRNGSNATGRWRGGLACLDVRDTNYTPHDLNMGLELLFLRNITNNLTDGGEYNGVFSFRQWASESDWSGGKAHLLSFTDNGNIWHRTSSGDDSWGAWKKLAYSTDIPSSLKNPYALTISLNGTSQGPYDGSAAKNINITPGSIGAATSGHNHDNRYLKLTGGTMQLGEGLKFHADENYFGTNLDARIISLLDWNDKICDGGLIIDERGTFEGKEYVTELLRIRDSEFKWKGSNILHSGNSNINGNTITINGSSLTVSKSDHIHDYLVINRAGESTLNSAYHNFLVLFAGESNGLSGRPSGVDAFGLIRLRAADGYSGQMLLANGGSLYIRSSTDELMTNTLAWKTILDSSNYSGILDARYYTESEVNNLLSNKLNTSDFNWTNLKDKPNTVQGYGISDALIVSYNGNNYVNASMPSSQLSKLAGQYYIECWDREGGWWNWMAGKFIKAGSSDSYVLLGGGGHKAESSLNVANADTVDGYHATMGNNKPWGTIPAINNGGWMDIGKQLEFHFDNTTGSDYSTVLRCTGNYSNIVDLPSAIGTLALTSDNVASATKLQTSRKIWGQSFDGTGDVRGDMTDVGIINTILNLKSKSGNASLYLETVAASTDYAHLFVTNKNDKNNVSRPLILQNGYGNVGIGTNSPSYKLQVNGDQYTTGWSRATNGFYCEDVGVHFTHSGSIGEIVMTSSNEFTWGTSTSVLYFNYRKASRGKTVTNYIWNAGSSTSWANHSLGALDLYGAIRFHNLIDIGSAIVLDYKYSAGAFARSIVSMKNSAYEDANLGSLSVLCDPNSTSNGFLYIFLGTGLYDSPNNLRIYKDKVTFGHNILIDAGNIGSLTVDKSYHLRVNHSVSTNSTWSTWYWIGQSGQPTWLWGTNDGTNCYVWNPSNFSVKYATNAGSATKVIVHLNTSSDTNYPLVWSSLYNSNDVTEDQLFKSWSDLCYNPQNKRLHTTSYVGIYANLTLISMRHIDAGLNDVQSDHNLYIGFGQLTYTKNTYIYASTGSGDTTNDRSLLALFNISAGINLDSNIDTRPSIIFRSNSLYKTTLSYFTAGNEALCFETKNAVTSIIFYNGATYAASTNHWYDLVNGVLIKNNCLAIGAGWANEVNPDYKLKVGGNGYFTGNSYATHFYESSDKTLKKNIKSILSSANIPKIREFDWKDTGEHSYGFIALELEELGYDCLVSEANGKKTVNYTATLALTVAKLLNLINIQNKKISNLTKELKVLKYGRKKNS